MSNDVRPLAICLLTCFAWPGLARAQAPVERPIEAHIVSRATGSDRPADESPKRERADVGVTMYAVLVTEAHGHRRYYSDAGRIRLRGKTLVARPLKDAPPALFAWFKVEPAVDDLSNTSSGHFHVERIDYDEVFVPGWLWQSTVAADVHPTLTPDRGHGLGTMRYELRAYTLAGPLATPGADGPRPRGGGLGAAVHRVSLRSDDTFLGYLTEMFGQPYIWASTGKQADALEGSDCADLMVYGWRRAGHQVAYTWTGALPKVTRLLGKGQRGPDGVYRDSRGRPLPFTRPGDLILFPRHVGALVADRGQKGVLDDADILMHTLFASPKEQPLADTGYADRPLEVRRWRF